MQLRLQSPATLLILQAVGKESDKHRLSSYSNGQYVEHIVDPDARAVL